MGLFDIFKKKDEALDPSVLQRVADIGAGHDLRGIVELLPFLPPPASPYGSAAALALEANVAAATPEEIATFDQWYRERTCSGPPRHSWENMGLGLDWGRQHFATVGIATCHRSGFIREKAVVTLAECHSGTELPFLLVRLNDWIPQVRRIPPGSPRH